MARIRFDALREASRRRPVEVIENEKRSERFRRNVFDQKAMRQYLSKDALESVQNAIHYGA